MRTQLTKIAKMAALAALLPLTSCDAANNPSALVGRWIWVSGSDKNTVMELLSDGTGIATKGSQGVAITWKTESDRIYLTTYGRAKAVSYKLQGSLLTFTHDDGEISELTKCKKDCQEAAKEYAEAKKAAALKAKFAGVKKGSFTDSRDGKVYKTVKLDNQTWMSENLSYNAGGSKCYDNNESNCQKYGRLYDGKTALNACPKDWHLPSDDEWETLVDFAGGGEAGNILKASVGWESNGNGVDAVGFAALPGGIGNSDGNSDGNFFNVGKLGRWWSSTGGDLSYTRQIIYDNADVDRSLSVKSLNGTSLLFSVRCVQD